MMGLKSLRIRQLATQNHHFREIRARLMTRKNIFSDLMPSDHAGSSFQHKEHTVKEVTNVEKASVAEETLAVTTKPKAKIEKPHHTGHRDRLRERFMVGGADSVADYELIEMLLFLGIPRRDVKQLAKELLNQFKTYPALLSAEIEDLMAVKGMTRNAVVALKLVRESAQRMLKQDIMGQPVLNGWGRLIDYLHATMAEEKVEHFRVLFLDRKNNLIADEIQQTGTVDNTNAYPREIVKRALQLSSTAIILVHNHPSGDHTPSNADITMTKQIVKAAQALEIAVHDHVIISKKGYTSFKSEGLM
jgi:DNA repair protein RadC